MYVVEDSQDAKRNRITVINGFSGPQFTAVISKTFTDESKIEPVTLDEARDWCMIDGNDYDNILLMLIPACRKQLERKRDVSLIQRTISAIVKPGTTLPNGPVREITSITDFEGNTYNDSVFVNRDVTVVYKAGFDEDIAPDLKIELLNLIKAQLPTL